MNKKKENKCTSEDCCHGSGHDHCKAHDHCNDHDNCKSHDHCRDQENINVDDFFRSLHNELAFLELKEDVSDPLGLPPNTPLPIRLRDFIEGDMEKFSESIPSKAIINGALWTLAIDPQFIHVDAYKDLIKRALKEPWAYAMSLAKSHFDKAAEINEELSKADDRAEDYSQKLDKELMGLLISLRAAYMLNKDDEIAALYGQNLWDLGPKNDFFFRESVIILQRLLTYDEDEKFLPNAVLGDIFAEKENYVKATSYYQKSLSSDVDEMIAEQIREKIRAISIDTALENAIYFINRADYERAMDYLDEARQEELIQKSPGRYDICYFKGLVEQNTGHYSEAVKSFKEAIDKGGSFPDLYNGLLYSLYADGKADLAIKAAEEGLAHFEDDLRLLFNRALIYQNMGENRKALEDLDRILQYDDISDELFNESMKLREEISSRL